MQSNPLALRLVQNKYLAAQQKRSVFTGLTERPLRLAQKQAIYRSGQKLIYNLFSWKFT